MMGFVFVATASTIFSLSSGDLARPLAVAVLLAFLVLCLRAWRSPHLARIGLRNATRRRLRSGLIIAGLMLATTFVATALTLDDTIVRAVKNVAVFSLGRVDEEVTGGTGPLGLYGKEDAAHVQAALQDDRRVVGVAPGIAIPDLLLVDQTTRQVRGDVLGVAIDPTAAGPLADLRNADRNVPAAIAALTEDQVYLNQSAAKLLSAHPGDTLYLFSSAWPGRRYQFTVLAVVTGGPLAVRPSLLLPLAQLQSLLGSAGQVNRVYIANSGDGISGVSYSDGIADKLRHALQRTFQVKTVKQDGVDFAVRAQDVFGRILALYTLFALSIGLLLIFLIFALLAAERRAELGMARAVGMHRSEVIWLFLFEGAAYDAAAAAPGLLAGLGLGILIIVGVSPTIARLGLPLQVDIEPQSIFVAFCLGLLFTLLTILLAVGTVTRLTVASALRDLPEPPPPAPPLWRLVTAAIRSTLRLPIRPGMAAAAWSQVFWAVTVRGLVPLVLGLWLLHWAVGLRNTLGLSLAVSCVLAGVVLVVRAALLAAAAVSYRLARRRDTLLRLMRLTQRADRLSALALGLALALYWSLPFDALRSVGLPRYTGGIEVFFAAGVMMVFGVVLAIAPNLDVLLAPLQALTRRLGRPRHVSYIALVYPSQQRLRTGISLAMFSLVCFTMVVMACIAASTTQRFGNLEAQAGGYDVIGQPLFNSVGGVDRVSAALRRADSVQADNITAVGAASPLPLIVIQPAAREARWGVYPAAAISGTLLDGQGLQLLAHAPGYANEADVWQALREQSGTAVIDVGALSDDDLAELGVDAPAPVSVEQFVAPPIASGLLGFSALEALLGRTAALNAENRVPRDVRDILTDPNRLRDYALHLQGVATGPGAMTPTTVWAADPRGKGPTKIQIIGIVANTTGQSYGLLASPDTFAPIEAGQTPFAGEFYFFKLRPGADPHAAALAIGSALLDFGFETTVIQDALLDVNGPAVFASRVLIGLVGLTLLVGMAALAVTGTRAVIERRQQIGMLRALGYHSRDVRRMFVLEAAFVAGLGAVIGLGLGLVLVRNVFAVSFLEQFRTGIALVIPWPALAAICALAIGAALVAAFLPAQQASQVIPAEALRYE